MHSTQPPVRRRATVIAIVCVLAMTGVLGWIVYLAIARLAAGLI